MAWLSPQLEVTKASERTVYSELDPCLDRERSDVSAYLASGDPSSLVWAGIPTEFRIRPISARDLRAVKLDMVRRWPDTDAGSVHARSRWVLFECYRLGCTWAACGEETYRGRALETIPDEVQLEIGAHVLELSSPPTRPTSAL